LVSLGACAAGPVASQASKQALTRLATTGLDGAARPVAASADITGRKPSLLRTSVTGLYAAPPTPPPPATPPKPASGTATPAQATTTGVAVRGGTIDTVPCLAPTDPAGVYTPNPGMPTTGTYECAGSSTFDGSWVGQDVYTAMGTVDLLTGNTSGTSDETLTGVYMDDDIPLPGTLHIQTTYVLDGRSGALHLDARIVGGEDSFAGSAGCFVVDGFEAYGESGHGGYSGTWFRSGADRQAIEAACPSA